MPVGFELGTVVDSARAVDHCWGLQTTGLDRWARGLHGGGLSSVRLAPDRNRFGFAKTAKPKNELPSQQGSGGSC